MEVDRFNLSKFVVSNVQKHTRSLSSINDDENNSTINQLTRYHSLNIPLSTISDSRNVFLVSPPRKNGYLVRSTTPVSPSSSSYTLYPESTLLTTVQSLSNPNTSGNSLKCQSELSSQLKIIDIDRQQRPLSIVDNVETNIRVNLLPQDSWNDLISQSELSEDGEEHDEDVSYDNNQKFCSSARDLCMSSKSKSTTIISNCFLLLYNIFIYLLTLITILTPILFIMLPKCSIFVKYETLTSTTVTSHSWDTFYGYMKITFKLILSTIGILPFLFYQRCLTKDLFKVFILIYLFLLTFFTWFFYIRLKQSSIQNIEYSLNYLDHVILVCLFYHVILVVVSQQKYLKSKFVIQMVRSPDGVSRQYSLGSMSIHEASRYLLKQYYNDFPIYNPWSFNIKTMLSGNTDGRSSTVHERLQDEVEYERRLRKRRVKLINVVEKAFNHVKRCNNKNNIDVEENVMNARSAAQAVFSSIARSLQKYLRSTRRQAFFTRDSIIDHLTSCLSFDIQPQAFLERYLQTQSILHTHNYCHKNIIDTRPSKWSLVNDDNRYCSTIYDGLIFVLKQNNNSDISLLCTVQETPTLELENDHRFVNLERNKFKLNLNSETSV
ncbi:unnamed protein product [Didymodactylos carnosus]|uniref:Vang-like protein n=1 Tax=Didymodactylos carnosus TaxID=1234261 RepID=A0A813QK64_9BILA|nr:unnamed protein product [Didymodactylos carnosus]CAF0791268.1 unnamed protein product [Didymodactylos carnosus]CAF3551174.1 unnamed protein product [Didymodactylos carnosus]CAF3573857.1 unnamed protein product [Didymodactylos carnosus]